MPDERQLDLTIERIRQILDEPRSADDEREVQMERDLVLALTAKLLLVEVQLLTQTADKIAHTLTRITDHYFAREPTNVVSIEPKLAKQRSAYPHGNPCSSCTAPGTCDHAGVCLLDLQPVEPSS